jgi:hypothetical protein
MHAFRCLCFLCFVVPLLLDACASAPLARHVAALLSRCSENSASPQWFFNDRPRFHPDPHVYLPVAHPLSCVCKTVLAGLRLAALFRQEETVKETAQCCQRCWEAAYTAVAEGIPSVSASEACLSRCRRATASSLHCPPACRCQPQARQGAAPVGRSRALSGGPALLLSSSALKSSSTISCSGAGSRQYPRIQAAALAAGRRECGAGGATLLQDCMQHCQFGSALPASADACCQPF